MKQRHVRQLLALSAIYFATSPAMAAGATASGAGSGAVSSGGRAAASSDATAAGAVSERGNAAELVAAGHLANEFETLAGSRENALSLVNGLRNSTPVSLTASGQSGASGRLIFSPPTQPMGYGEISRALSLTRSQFAAQGITNPTPEQLKIALIGGVTTSGTGKNRQTAGTTGVLELRKQGMGWGQIAQNLNVSPSGHPVTDAQVSTQATAVTGHGSANTNSEGTAVNGSAQVEVGTRIGLPQGSVGLGGAAGLGRGLGLGR